MLKKSFNGFLLTFTLVAFLCQGVYNTTSADEREYDLTGNGTVNPVKVPFFAVDSQGNPVYDLEQDDLELLINDQPVPFTLNRDLLNPPNKPLKTGPPSTADQINGQHRMVFVILDAIFNTNDGFYRGKKMISEMVRHSKRNDRFVIILLTPAKGLEYVAGPLRPGPELFIKIDGIKLKPLLWKEKLFSQQRIQAKTGNEEPGKMTGKMEKMQYMSTMKQFGFLLSQFQNALRTTSGPKLVFLVTGGVSRNPWEYVQIQADEGDSLGKLFSRFHLQYLRKVGKSVNRGGGVLYTINPNPTQDNTRNGKPGGSHLNAMARSWGGKHIQGTDVEEVMKEIQRSTSAYYEMTFSSLQVQGRTLVVRILSKRSGLDIHTSRYASISIPYSKLNRIRKKLFALNVVTGGTWSRMTGTIKQSEFSVFKSKGEPADSAKRLIRVPIPKIMRNRNVDVFLVETNPKTKKVYIEVKNQVVKEVEQIEVNLKSPEITHQYLALIEPENPFCIYGRIK